MKRKHDVHPVFQGRTPFPVLTFILLIVAVSFAACNIPFGQPNNAQEFPDKNARMYQMYFDSSGDPALNELQIRRFMGHLHMADIVAIFGDIQTLPLNQDCNYAAGPVLGDEGTAWFMTSTPDLVGVNLISITPDGTRSSAFDLNGDRVIEILDIFLADNRRFTFFTEELGMDVFRNWLQGLDPFCNPELIQQLGLPDLGCDETADGSSSGGAGVGGSNDLTGAGLYDPIAEACAEYETGPRADFMAHNPARGSWERHQSSPERYEFSNGVRRDVQTWEIYDSETGQWIGTEKLIVDTDMTVVPPEIVQVTEENVSSAGIGHRFTVKYNADGSTTPETTNFNVKDGEEGQPGYSQEESDPPPQAPEGRQGQSSNDTQPQAGTSPNQENPGPEGSDIGFAEFCRARANYRSGIEQAVSQDPAAINLSCGDLVGAPSGGNCSIIQWAGPEDFNGVLEPPEGDEGCDEFSNSEGSCEGASVEDRIRQFLGHGADLWSLDLPAIDICPDIVCNPGGSIELQSYTAGEINIACPVVATGTSTLEPSEENCPPGTFYAPVTNRCIAIQLPEAGDGGEAGGGSCTLSASACSAEGLSFDSNTCSCVPIE